MPVKKKNHIRKTGKNRNKLSLDSSNVVIVVHTREKETLFPEKLAKVNAMLANAKLMD
jgi:hypothetical protein